MFEAVKRYYETRRVGSDNVFSIWERGEAYLDSVTPSIWDPAYRAWITEVIETNVGANHASPILSVGCGNAFVESDLTKRGYNLSAIDICPGAVVLARKKGVAAIEADVYTWEPDRPCNLIYCDGVVGHLYRHDGGCQPAFRRMNGWLAGGSGSLLISNDISLTGQDVQEHPAVQQFFLFSTTYLERQLAYAGFEVVSSRTYIYSRPLSGDRSRAVIVARNSA
jgi:SAM-dependent methyltransferase